MPKWLRWNQDQAELRLDASALESLKQAKGLTTIDDFTRNLNYTLISSSQGFSLVTLMHKALLPWPPASEDGSHSDRNSQPGRVDPFVPMLASTISFGGDSMNQLHRDFVNKLDEELRETVIAIHFQILASIVSALPRVLTRRVLRVKAFIKHSRLLSLVLSGAFGFPSLTRPWLGSHLPAGSKCSPIIALILLLIWRFMPWLIHQGVKLYIRSKVGSIQSRWKQDANLGGV